MAVVVYDSTTMTGLALSSAAVAAPELLAPEAAGAVLVAAGAVSAAAAVAFVGFAASMSVALTGPPALGTADADGDPTFVWGRLLRLASRLVSVRK